MKKQVLSACLAGTMLLGAVTVPAMAVSVDQLTDVKKTDWFYSAVQYVAEKDYMIGVTDDLFAPAREMSRAMFVVILHRLDGGNSTGASNFVDVPADAWCAQAVNWATKNGIVYGINEKEFSPNAPVTREQMCAMMARFLDYRTKKDNKTYPASVPEKTFLDAASIGAFAKEAVKQCQMWGLVYGEKDGKFYPQDNSTRAEVAAVIQRLDVLLSSGKGQGGGAIGGGGGGGGGGGAIVDTKTASYTIKATLNVPDTVSTTDPELLAAYSNVTVSSGTVTGDLTFGQVAKDLVSGENANVLSNVINEALNKVKGKTFTQTVNDQQVTISISDAGVISASAAMDLGTYYDQAVEKFNISKTEAISRMESELGLTFTAGQKAKAEAVYDLNDPANYVTNNGNGTLTLKTAAQYRTLIQDNVAKAADFYASLDKDAAFYQSLLERVENKYQDGYGVSYTGSVTDAAALMGDKDGILVDESKNFRNSMTFSVTVVADEDTYFAWRDLITGKFSQAGSILPSEMTGALAKLVGDYTLKLSVTKN